MLQDKGGLLLGASRTAVKAAVALSIPLMIRSFTVKNARSDHRMVVADVELP